MGTLTAPLDELLRALPDRVLTTADEMDSYTRDASRATLDGRPRAVVRASSTQDVSVALRWADAHRVPVSVRGSGTGLTGGAVAYPDGLVVSLAGLDRIHGVDPANRLADVQAGVLTAEIDNAAAAYGLMYAPDPASYRESTIGGNIATNAGGLCCVKYGVTADYVRGLDIVLPGGETMRTGRRTAKGVAGFDLTGLFVGSEGLLGVVTSAVVRLIAAPDPALTALATFASLDAATAGILALRADPYGPSLLELLDADTIVAVQAVADFGFPADCAAVLIVQSDRPGHVGEDVHRYASLLEAAGATDVAVADDAQEAEALMAGRRALHVAHETKGPHFTEDVCVPVARLADLIRAGHEISERRGVDVTLSGHAGDGNLHPCFFFAAGDADSMHRAEQAFDDLVHVALALGGTITGEHGVGSLKMRWLPQELGEAEMARQRAVKAVFDPLGIMNPGKVL